MDNNTIDFAGLIGKAAEGIYFSVQSAGEQILEGGAVDPTAFSIRTMAYKINQSGYNHSLDYSFVERVVRFLVT